MAEPIEIGDTQAHVTASLGFALARKMQCPDGAALLQAATLALIEAQHSGGLDPQLFQRDAAPPQHPQQPL